MSSTPQSPTFESNILEAMSVSLPSLDSDQHPASTVTLHKSFDQGTTHETDEPIAQQEYFNYNDFSMANELFLGADWVHSVSNYDQQSYLQPSLHHDQQQTQLLPTAQGLPQSSPAIGQEYTDLPTLAQSYSTVGYLQTVEQFQSLSQSQSGPFPPFQEFIPHSTSMALATPSFISPLPSESTTHLLCPEPAGYLSNYFETTYSQVSSQQPPTAIYGTRFEQPLHTEFNSYRSPTFDRLSSPDDCSSPLSSSESPFDQGYFESSDADSRAISIAFSASSLSGSTSPSTSSPALQGETFEYYYSGLGDTLTGPVSDLRVSPHGSSTSTMADPYGIASPKDKIRSRRPQQLIAGSSSPVEALSASSLLSTTPTQSSPLKQQFSSFESDGDQSDNDDDGDQYDHDDEDTDEGRDKDVRPKKKQRKRARRDNEDKPKTPRLVLPVGLIFFFWCFRIALLTKPLLLP